MAHTSSKGKMIIMDGVSPLGSKLSASLLAQKLSEISLNTPAAPFNEGEAAAGVDG